MKNKKIVELKPRRAVSIDTVENIKELLADIKRGEIVSVAVATVVRDGGTTSFFDAERSPALIGSVARLQHRMLNQ